LIKKQLVVDILNDVFGQLDHKEIENIREQCQYDFDNNLIEVIPFRVKLLSIFWNYIKRKI
jgi:hypothetical protein